MTSGPPAATTRLAWIDFARGCTITLVVYGHCFRGLRAAGLVPGDSPLSVADYVIYGFHMPLFFFLAGVFSARPGASAAWRGRCATLIKTYVIWMTLQMVLQSHLASLTNGESPIRLSTYLVAPAAPFWFLYALVACTVFGALLARRSAAVLLACGIAVFAAGQFVPVQIVQLTSWGMLYFAAGLAGAHAIRQPGFGRAIASVPAFLACGAGTVLAGLLFWRLGTPNSLEVPAAVLGTGAVFCASSLIVNRQVAWIVGPVTFLGRISLTILVVHILGTAGARIVLTHGLGVHSLWVHIPAGVAAGLLLSACVQVSAEWFGVAALLGLPRGICFAAGRTPALLAGGRLLRAVGLRPQLDQHGRTL